MWLPVICITLISIIIGVIIWITYIRSYYNWIPAFIDNPLSGNISNIKTLKPILPKNCNKTFGAADPFIVNGYVFAELMKKGKGILNKNKGIIAVAKITDTVLDFKPIIEESFHMSYPYVFKHSENWYMIPETYQSGSILLYKATSFPYKWEKVGSIYEIDGMDSIPFYLNNKWYIFTSSVKTGETLIITTDNFPSGPWTVERKKPLPKGYRGGGQALYIDGEVLLPLQPPSTLLHGYGWKLELFKINNGLIFHKTKTLLPPDKAGGLHHLSYDHSTGKYMVDLRHYLKN